MLVDRPGKFIVQLPSDQGEEHGAERQHTRCSNETRLQIHPNTLGNVASKLFDGLIDLVHFHRRVDHHTEIVDANSNHLNRVLQAQRIPH